MSMFSFMIKLSPEMISMTQIQYVFMYYTSIYSTKHGNWVNARIHYFAGRHLEYLVTAGDTKNPPGRLLLSDRSITRNSSQKPYDLQCIRHLWTEPGLNRYVPFLRLFRYFSLKLANNRHLQSYDVQWGIKMFVYMLGRYLNE